MWSLFTACTGAACANPLTSRPCWSENIDCRCDNQSTHTEPHGRPMTSNAALWVVVLSVWQTNVLATWYDVVWKRRTMSSKILATQSSDRKWILNARLRLASTIRLHPAINPFSQLPFQLGVLENSDKDPTTCSIQVQKASSLVLCPSESSIAFGILSYSYLSIACWDSSAISDHSSCPNINISRLSSTFTMSQGSGNASNTPKKPESSPLVLFQAILMNMKQQPPEVSTTQSKS